MRLPDNRKALDGLWELSIIVPIAAFSRHVMLRRSRSVSCPAARLRSTVRWVGVQGVEGRSRIRGARASRSFFMARRIRVFTVPSGVPSVWEISEWVSPLK